MNLPLMTKRIINDVNIQSFTNTIKNVSWDNVLSKNNTAESYNEFFNLLSIAYEKNFPLRRKVVKRNIDKTRSPWMTKCIAKSVKQKNKLYKKIPSMPYRKKGKNIQTI
jgi:sialic acid synthase SpsE